MDSLGKQLPLTGQAHLVEFVEDVLFEALHFSGHFLFGRDIEIDVYRCLQVAQNFYRSLRERVDLILCEVKTAQTLPSQEPVSHQANTQTQGDRHQKGIAGCRAAANVQKEPVEKQKDRRPDEK